jgi:hypothetical protein
MPTLKNINLTIVKDVANANFTVDYDIEWSPFEQQTNLEFDEFYKLIGDDTGQDADDLPVGDDPIDIGLVAVGKVSSNGAALTHRTKSRTIAFSNLNEDKTAPATNDDEIRAVVTLGSLRRRGGPRRQQRGSRGRPDRPGPVEGRACRLS